MKILRFCAAAAAVAFCGVASAANFADTAKESADLWIQQDKSGYSVEFVGDGNIAGMQFDIHDKSIVEGSYSCGEALASTHIASCTLHAKEGYLRVLVYTVSKNALGDTTLVRVSTNASSKGNASFAATNSKSSASLKNILFSDANAQDVTPDHL